MNQQPTLHTARVRTALFTLTLLASLGAGCASDPPESMGTMGTGGTTGTGGATGPGGATGSGGVGAPPMGTGCDPMCMATNGISIGCARRFMYGVNYAWSRFAGDFGGTPGVTANRTNVLNQLTDMRANGVDSVRWWVWPNLNAANVLLDAAGTPTGLGPNVVDDLNNALSLAAQVGVHIQFTMFSFDNFRPDTASIKSLRPIVIDGAKRAALMNLAIRPFARAVAASPNAAASIGWDIINEPEWAMSGSNGYGDPAYTPQTNLQTVTHPEMETFVADTIAAIRAESALPITVGAAAAKWSRAWSRVDIDYYTIHIYDWVNTGGWPYTRSPAELGFSGKPVVMGEFPLNGLPGVTYNTMVSSWFANGYAGALGWSVTERSATIGNWAGNKTNVKAFADTTGCVTRY